MDFLVTQEDTLVQEEESNLKGVKPTEKVTLVTEDRVVSPCQGEAPQREDSRHISPTRVDLETQQVQPGLGPAHLEDLDIVKVDIGLRAKVVTLDYPSPEDPKVRYGGLQLSQKLSQKQIERAKEVCSKDMVIVNFNNNFYAKHAPMDSDSDSENSKADYVVEYPPEDKEDGATTGCKLGDAEELTLVSSVQMSLSMKRNRGWLDDGVSCNREELSPKRLRDDRLMLLPTSAFSDLPLSQDIDMTEEAGRSMPPPPP